MGNKKDNKPAYSNLQIDVLNFAAPDDRTLYEKHGGNDVNNIYVTEAKESKFNLGKFITIAGLLLTLIGGGGFLGWYELYRDSHPVHHKIKWSHKFKKQDYLEQYNTSPAMPIGGEFKFEEKTMSFPLHYLKTTGYCTVKKEKDIYTLQVSVDYYLGRELVGNRVTVGCSSVEYGDKYSAPLEGGGTINTYKSSTVSCCWVDE